MLVLAMERSRGGRTAALPSGVASDLWSEHRFPVTMAAGQHPFPFRTRQLSPPAPMVLGGRLPGRVGRRRDISKRRALARAGARLQFAASVRSAGSFAGSVGRGESRPVPGSKGRPVSTVLEVEGLRTEFRLKHSTVVAVDDVSFHVEEGECVGVVGESGCGKTTTGLSIMRLLPNVGHITGGSIQPPGPRPRPLSEKEMCQVRGNEIGMIFQDPLTSLNPTMTIGRQIAESVRLHRGATKAQARERALEVLSLVDMPRPPERLDTYPHQLSGGLRQRVMIAMALACEPKLLIADEPTTALDVTIQAQILDLIDSLRQQLEMAVILITHDMGVIAGRTDRVLVMYAGKIVEEASTLEIFTAMRHPYSEALLASVPKLDQDASVPLRSIAGLPPTCPSPSTSAGSPPGAATRTTTARRPSPPLERAGAQPGPPGGVLPPRGRGRGARLGLRPDAVAKSADVPGRGRAREPSSSTSSTRAEASTASPCSSRWTVW